MTTMAINKKKFTQTPADKAPLQRSLRVVSTKLVEMIDPFGWTVNEAALTEWPDTQLKTVELWLAAESDDSSWIAPDWIFKAIDIPYGLRKAFKNDVDCRALLSVMLETHADFSRLRGSPEIAVEHLKNREMTQGIGTPFGTVYIEAETLSIWFGRKHRKLPALSGAEAIEAINTLFNIADLRKKTEERKAESGKPEASAASENRKRKTAEGDRHVKSTPALDLLWVPLTDISPSPDNHRKDFDPVKLQELADSIEQRGILSPLLLRLIPNSDRKYEIVAGERRYRAAQLAGAKHGGTQVVPARIVEMDGLQRSLAMYEENKQRENLNPIEEAQAVKSMMETYSLTQAEVGKVLGKIEGKEKVSQGQVSNQLRLLDLPPTLQAEVASGAIAPYLIRPALRFTDVPDVIELLTESLSVDAGPHTEDSINSHLTQAILAASRSMTYRSTWQPSESLSTEDRHFSDLSPKDLKRLDVRRCECLSGQERAFNVEVFNELNAAPLAERTKAKAAWKAKNKAEKSSPAASKTKPADVLYFTNKFTVERAIEAEMNGLLAAAIEKSRDKAGVLRLVLAFAVATEGALLQKLGHRREGVNAGEDTRAVIDSLTGSAADMHATLRAATIAVLREEECLSVEECYCYATVLGIQLWEHWLVTPELLELLTDAGRAEFDDREPGYIPDFMRPFFTLDVDGPKKSKKGRAAW